MGRPRLHDAVTAAALLDEAELIVEAEGLDALTVRRVATAAGTTTRAVYTIYGSKDALVIALGTRGFDLLREELEALPEMRDPAADLVEAGVVVFRRFATEHPALFRISIQRALPDPSLFAGYVIAGREAMAALHRRFVPLEAADGLGGRTVADAAAEFHALCEGLAAVELRGMFRAGEEERIWRDALGALVRGFAISAGDPGRKRRTTIPAMFQKTTLQNGLRVVTAPMPAAKSVAVMVMLAAGSRYETAETNGIAHFAEHMFFKGTERRPTAKDISAEVDGIGGEFNAFTSKEYTGYYIKCAAEHRSLALDVLADQLLNSKFDAEEVEREKGVIIEELNMYVDTPRDHVDSVYDQLLFGDQPLGWDIIGRKETIRAAGRQTFLDYLDAWYAPQRMVVGAAGAVDGEFAAEVERQFGHLGDRATGTPAPTQVEQAAARVKLETRDSDQAHLRLGVRGLPTTHSDRYTMQVLGSILGGGMSSRLFTEVRERLGLAYYVFCHHQSYEDTGTLFSQSGVDIKRIDLAVQTILREFGKLVREPVDEVELRRTKNYLKGRMVLQLEDPRGLLSFGLRREVLENRLAEPEEVLEGVEAVTAADIERLAGEVIRDEGLNFGVVGPFDDDAHFLELMTV